MIARAEDASKKSAALRNASNWRRKPPLYCDRNRETKDEKTGQPEPDIGVQEKQRKTSCSMSLWVQSHPKGGKCSKPLIGKDRKIPSVRAYLRAAKEVRRGGYYDQGRKPSVREELRENQGEPKGTGSGYFFCFGQKLCF